MLKAECLRVLGRPEDGLRWLAKEIASDPGYWERPTVCYDVFEQIPWTEIGWHWVALYKDAWTFNPEFVRFHFYIQFLHTKSTNVFCVLFRTSVH
jgi:hypothetical protein